MLHTKYLIVGTSAAGISAANTLARLEPEVKILCIGTEKAAPYNKCFLVDWIAGERAESELYLPIKDQVQVLAGIKVDSIDPINKEANLSDGRQVRYEKVLLGIGVQAFRPQITGWQGSNHVFTFHTFADTVAINQYINQVAPKRAVVIGAGLTGLECADALARKGLQVSVVERGSQVLARHVDSAGAAKLADWMQEFGVELEVDAEVVKIDAQTVHLKSGKSIPADLVIVAVGVRPNKIDILGSKLEYAQNYVLVDDLLKTSLPDVWAAGDMIVVPDILTGELVPSSSWPDAMMQGNIAAQNMAGRVKKYPGMLAVANSHFFGKDFISFGDLTINSANGPLIAGSYHKYILDCGSVPKGAILIGDTSIYPRLRRSILANQPFTP